MKIGVIIISWDFAGAENFVYHLCKEYLKKGIDVELFVNEEIKKYYSDIVKINNLGKLSKNIFFKAFLSYKIENKINQLTKANKFDAIHLQMDIPTILYKKAFRKNKIPFIITIHGSEIERYLNSNNLFYKNIIKPKVRYMFKNSSFLISVGKNQTINLDTELKNKLKIIPNGVNINLFKPINNKNKNIITFVGRYIDIKGLNEILSIAKKLPRYEFWFAGQGPLKKLIKGKNIKDLGFKKAKELSKIYGKSKICIFPSYREGFGLVGLEAMACGKPVIATPLGFSEYIENGKDGIIIPAKDEKALEKAIVKLMENPKLREKLGKAARKKAEQYSWDKVANQYIKVFKEVLKKS